MAKKNHSYSSRFYKSMGMINRVLTAFQNRAMSKISSGSGLLWSLADKMLKWNQWSIFFVVALYFVLQLKTLFDKQEGQKSSQK